MYLVRLPHVASTKNANRSENVSPFHEISCILVTLDVKLLRYSLWYIDIAIMLIKYKSKMLPDVLYPVFQMLSEKADGKEAVLVMFMASLLK